MTMSADQLREEVRLKYAEAAVAAGTGGCGCTSDGGCCGNVTCDGEDGFWRGALRRRATRRAPRAAVLASLGCGNPTAVADLREGETVLDLGSGGGIDVILSAKRVGPTGLAYGLDMTEEMLALARRNADDAGVRNAIFLRGIMEDVPLPADSVDVVISNCVVNLSTDKPAVFAELARVLKPGGRVGISDIVAEDRLSPRSGANAVPTSAASPERFHSANTRRHSREPASRTWRWTSRTRSPTACTAPSSRLGSPRAEQLREEHLHARIDLVTDRPHVVEVLAGRVG